MSEIAAFLLTLLASGYLFTELIVFGRRRRLYRHTRDTISELGEFGAPDERMVAVGVFLPVGVVLLLVAALLRGVNWPAALLALCVAVGYLTAAAFPCDPGSPLSGSPRQGLHNLGGAAEYIGGGIALFKLSETLGRPFGLAGLVVLSTAIALSIPGIAAIRGLIQRVAELCLFVGLAVAIWLGRTVV
jgi:Protein of unknown function (DUF998)